MNKRIDEIRERCNAATPGPWGAGGIRKNLIQTANAPFFEVCTVRGGSSFRDIDGQQKLNADFIAHAREDIPYLLGEIERLQAVPYALLIKKLSRRVEELERDNAMLKEMYATVSAGKVKADADLAEAQRREEAVIKDIPIAVHHHQGCCSICKNAVWDDEMEKWLCTTFAKWPRHECFAWRGPQDTEGKDGRNE